MSLTNYHTHSHYCDGNGVPEEYVKAAIEKGMATIGFSSHSPVPFNSFWNMPNDKLPNYLSEIKELKKRYESQIQVFCSLEVDYIKGLLGPKSEMIIESDLDYVIGSVHYLGQFADGSYWAIDGSYDSFQEGLTKIYGGDIKRVVKLFYEAQKEMVQNECPDIIGHLDKIKMHNSSKLFFSEDEKWYKDELLELFGLIKQKGCIVEINTKSFLRKDELFPGKQWFKTIKEFGIPVVLNSDSHYASDITNGFLQVQELLKNVGIKGEVNLISGCWEFEKWKI